MAGAEPCDHAASQTTDGALTAAKLTAQSTIELLSGSLVTEVALTAIAAASGGVLAPLLPVLAKSLAASRQQQRVEAALRDLTVVLEAHEHQVEALTDAQYKLANEAVLAVLQTTQAEKLSQLRNVIRNALYVDDLGPQEAIVLSRIIRDISAEEVNFLITAFSYDSIRLVDSTTALEFDGANGLRVPRSSPDSINVSGLLSLGLLAPGETSWGGTGSMMFTPITAKLIAILRVEE